MDFMLDIIYICAKKWKRDFSGLSMFMIREGN